jgi:hypothetical protein
LLALAIAHVLTIKHHDREKLRKHHQSERETAYGKLPL